MDLQISALYVCAAETKRGHFGRRSNIKLLLCLRNILIISPLEDGELVKEAFFKDTDVWSARLYLLRRLRLF